MVAIAPNVAPLPPVQTPPPASAPSPFAGIGAPVVVPPYAPPASGTVDRAMDRPGGRSDRSIDEDDYDAADGGRVSPTRPRRRRRRHFLLASFSAPFITQFIAQEVLSARKAPSFLGDVLKRYIRAEAIVQNSDTRSKVRRIAA